MVDYVGIASSTKDAIEDSGTTVTLRRYAPSMDGSEPWKTSGSVGFTDYSVYAVRDEFRVEQMDDRVVQLDDVKYIIPADGLAITPQAGDVVIQDDIIYRVIRVETIKPATVAVMYTLHTRLQAKV